MHHKGGKWLSCDLCHLTTCYLASTEVSDKGLGWPFWEHLSCSGCVNRHRWLLWLLIKKTKKLTELLCSHYLWKSLQESPAASATVVSLWWLVKFSCRMWLIIAHASNCSAPDNDGSVDLSLLPHGLLLNDSGVMSTADCNMIHVVFGWVKFVWVPCRHLSPRCWFSLLCLPLSQYGKMKKMSQYFVFFFLTGY